MHCSCFIWMWVSEGWWNARKSLSLPLKEQLIVPQEIDKNWGSFWEYTVLILCKILCGVWQSISYIFIFLVIYLFIGWQHGSSCFRGCLVFRIEVSAVLTLMIQVLKVGTGSSGLSIPYILREYCRSVLLAHLGSSRGRRYVSLRCLESVSQLLSQKIWILLYSASYVYY
jgi:hypothetical protein